MDIVDYNRRAWDESVKLGDRWTVPVSPEIIAAARAGTWEIVLTPAIPVPRAWFGDVAGRDVLCLASGGGQQAPILAAAGGRVTSYDNSEEQLARDREVADRDGLELRTVRGDMADLSALADASFDTIVHPVSNVFAEDVKPVWRECHRVLRPGGRLLAGFMNPAYYLFDHDEIDRGGPMTVRFPIPYSDVARYVELKDKGLMEPDRALEFSHTLDDQIGGQLAAGFVLTGFYEDKWDTKVTPLNDYMAFFIATLARKVVVGA